MWWSVLCVGCCSELRMQTKSTLWCMPYRRVLWIISHLCSSLYVPLDSCVSNTCSHRKLVLLGLSDIHKYLCVTDFKNLIYIICELLSHLVKDHWMLHSVYQRLFSLHKFQHEICWSIKIHSYEPSNRITAFFIQSFFLQIITGLEVYSRKTRLKTSTWLSNVRKMI